jgi:hypothetical protein
MSFRQRAVIEFLVKEVNSAAVIYERLRVVSGDVCMAASSVRRCVKHFKDGNTDIADQLRYDRPRTAATERKKRKVNKLIRQDRRITFRVKCSVAWSGAPCGTRNYGDFGITENLFPLCSPFPYGYRGTQNGWELLSHITYSPYLAPSDYRFFVLLKDHLRGHHYETDEAVQEAVRSWL